MSGMQVNAMLMPKEVLGNYLSDHESMCIQGGSADARTTAPAALPDQHQTGMSPNKGRLPTSIFRTCSLAAMRAWAWWLF